MKAGFYLEGEGGRPIQSVVFDQLYYPDTVINLDAGFAHCSKLGVWNQIGAKYSQLLITLSLIFLSKTSVLSEGRENMPDFIQPSQF